MSFDNEEIRRSGVILIVTVVLSMYFTCSNVILIGT